MAVANYHDTEGHYPQPYLTDKDGDPMRSWRIAILPFIDQDKLFKEYLLEERWDGPNNSLLADRMPKIYSLHCESKPGMTIANYLAIVGQQTVWRPGKLVTRGEVTDGNSNTILIVENRGMNIPWMAPRDLDFDTMDWAIDSPRGISSRYNLPGAVFLDGSVRTLSKKLSPDAVRAMTTIAGDEKFKGDFELAAEIPDGRDRPVTKP